MSLTKVRLIDVIKRQYQFKLKAYSQVLVSLMILQAIGIVFSLGGTGMTGSSSDILDLEVHYYSADIIIVFTLLWGFSTAMLTTTKGYRYDDFAFVSNRFSSNLSNTLFLLTASVVGGITAILSSYLLKIIIYFFIDHGFVKGLEAGTNPLTLLMGIVTTSLYIFLFCSIGYLVGMLVQRSKLFIVLLPAFFFGSIMFAESRGEEGIIAAVYHFFFTESSLILFMVKIIVTILLFFACSFVLSNRMEVKQG